VHEDEDSGLGIVAGRGLQPRPKRSTDEVMAVVIENGRGGRNLRSLGWAQGVGTLNGRYV